MYKLKKILAVLLAALMLFAVSCTKSNENEVVNPSDNGSNITENNSYEPTVRPDGSITLKPQESVTDTEKDDEKNHIDKNDDGKCDNCNESVLVYINFFAVNDLHGKLTDSGSQPGVDELSTYFKNAYKTEQNVVVLSSGDMWQGTAESGLTNGKIMTEWMNYIGFEAMTVGNHEYDWGSDDIEENAKIADFPILAINIYSRDDNERVDYCEASVLIERDGVKIGIIGAVGNVYSSIASDMTKDVYFKTGDALTKLIKAESEKLRSQGADVIVYSIHDGYGNSDKGMIADSQLAPYYDISLSAGGYVDVVFEGHSHKNYSLKDSYGVYHVQGGGENSGVSHVKLAVNTVNDNNHVTSTEFVQNTLYRYYDSDPIVETLLKKYEKELAITKNVLGKNSKLLKSYEICNLVAKLYFETGTKKWGDKYNITLGGGYLNTRSPYELPAGDVTYSALYSLLTFDNELVLCSVKGSDLKEKFFNNKKYYIYSKNTVSDIKDNETYYIIVDSYTSTYKPNKLTEIERFGEDIYARDLLAEYIKQGKLN